jgi:exopolyphosphatase/guanosine-5'-triphosphate,3'-diphosphate pyrophosphatase
MRVGVVDIGTNSTRLLVAEVEDGRLTREVERRTRVTRLGEGVDRTGRLGEEPMARVLDACAAYREALDRHGAERVVAVLTSAVRDAANGRELERRLAERFGFEASTITGEREARLTYLGATNQRTLPERVLVIDIGGGSTELVIGSAGELDFHVSTQVGSVRFTERHLSTDPPLPAELRACAAAVRAELEREVPERARELPRHGIAVAGTPTSLAAIEMSLVPYDPDRVDGHRLARSACERMLHELAELPLERRRAVAGLHPDRAPTIVAGTVILIEAMALFGLEAVEVSEHDILEGAALEAAAISG